MNNKMPHIHPTYFRHLLGFLITCVAALLISWESHAQEQEQPRLVSPSEATSGSLLLETTTPGKYIEAPALVTDVEIHVSGPIARTKVTQRFENTSSAWVEGIYVFPLPDESAIDTLRMQIGNKFIQGEIKEREAARQIYEEARASGRKASLLEQQRANIFTNNVANIGPGETVIVQIEYQETIVIDDGRFSLRFPMVVGPRYNPPAQVIVASIDEGTGWAVHDPVPDRDEIEPPYLHPDLGPVNPVHLRVDIDAGFPIGTLASSYHDVVTHWDGKTRAQLELADSFVPANRDFELVWAAEDGGTPSAALFSENIAGEDYFLLMVTPPETEGNFATQPREVIFVIDTSGSMGGESIRQARASLAMAVQRLAPDDTFNVIEFNSNTNTLFSGAETATPRRVRQALTWIEGLEARGGTEMLPALRTALSSGETETGRLRQVIFLTDGAIGNEQALFETIAQGRGEARIFTVGIGSAPNSYFMSRAAELGQGAFTHIGSTQKVAERMGALFVKLETPIITDLVLSWPERGRFDATYELIPDLYKGETLTVAARASTDSGELTLSGVTGNQPWIVKLTLDEASERAGISKLWARKKIADLELERVRSHPDDDTLDMAILDIALTHHLISRLTSLVAVDITPSRPEGVGLANRDIPLNLPAGWDFEKVFGENVVIGNAPPLEQVLRNAGQLATDKATTSPRSVQLPQTATLSQVRMILGSILLILALMVFLRGRVGFGS